MKKDLMMFALGCLILGCAPKIIPAETPDLTLQAQGEADTTDVHACSRGRQANSPLGHWQMTRGTSRRHNVYTMQITQNDLTFNGACTEGGATDQVSVQVPIQHGVNSITVLQAANQKVNSCGVNLKKGMVMRYTYRGSCLTWNENGKSTRYVMTSVSSGN